MITVMVTGAGGPAGVSVIRSLLARGDVRIIASDMDPWASGLYLVPAGQQCLVPPGLAPGFVDAVLKLCDQFRVDVLFPTVDVELPLLAARAAEFVAAGTALASPSLFTLETCLDKYALAQHCAGSSPVPRTELLDAAAARGRQYPVIVKPRRGAGSRGVRVIESEAELLAVGTDPDLIVQDFLPGQEYSVDVLADLDGHVIAAVPRLRVRVDSGVSVAGVTVHDDELESVASAVASAVRLTTVANVQLRRDAEGHPALLEVNPRFPGAMPLTMAAGVDMPSLLLDLILGREVPDHVDFSELGVVRYLDHVIVPLDQLLEGAEVDYLPTVATAQRAHRGNSILLEQP